MSKPGSMTFAERVSAYEAYLKRPHGRFRSEIVWQQLSGFMITGWGSELPSLQVLDIGCGTGELALRLAARGHAVTLLDPAKEMLDLAQEKARAMDPPPRIPPRFLAGSIEEGPDLLAGNAFDLLLCHTVVEYLANPEGAFAPLRSLLNLEGCLSLVSLNRWQEPFRLTIRDHKPEEAIRSLAGESFRDTVFDSPRKAMAADELCAHLEANGIEVTDHQGILVFSDYLPPAILEDAGHRETLLRLELEAGSRSPYKEVARYIHLWGRRTG